MVRAVHHGDHAVHVRSCATLCVDPRCACEPRTERLQEIFPPPDHQISGPSRHQTVVYVLCACQLLHRSVTSSCHPGFEGWHLFISWRTQPATASTCVSRVLVVGGMSKIEELSVSDREFLRKDVLVRVRLDLCMFVGVALGRNSQDAMLDTDTIHHC